MSRRHFPPIDISNFILFVLHTYHYKWETRCYTIFLWDNVQVSTHIGKILNHVTHMAWMIGAKCPAITRGHNCCTFGTLLACHKKMTQIWMTYQDDLNACDDAQIKLVCMQGVLVRSDDLWSQLNSSPVSDHIKVFRPSWQTTFNRMAKSGLKHK